MNTRTSPQARPAGNDAPTLPLTGIRVIDFTQVMMGPVCTQMLADYGADVIKVERKGAGDLSRSTVEPVAGADNPIFCSLNRNKRSVVIDLRDAEQMAQVKALIREAREKQQKAASVAPAGDSPATGENNAATNAE